MRLYTFQTLEVTHKIFTLGIYTPEWDRCDQFDEDTHLFREQYQFMTDEYNRRKGTNFTTPPVWWYTSLRQLRQILPHISREVILTAEVPDHFILEHDYEDWHMPLNNGGLGFLSTGAYCNWPREKDEVYDRVSEQMRLNQVGLHETWKEIFNLPQWKRNSPDITIHATTQEIRKEWLE